MAVQQKDTERYKSQQPVSIVIQFQSHAVSFSVILVRLTVLVSSHLSTEDNTYPAWTAVSFLDNRGGHSFEPVYRSILEVLSLLPSSSPDNWSLAVPT